MSGPSVPNEYPGTCPNEMHFEFDGTIVTNIDTATTSIKITFLLEAIRYFTERLNDLTQHKFSQYLKPDVVQTIALLIASYQLGGINSLLATSMISLVLHNSEYLSGNEKMLSGSAGGIVMGIPLDSTIFSAGSRLVSGLLGTVAGNYASFFAKSSLGFEPNPKTSSDLEKAINRP